MKKIGRYIVTGVLGRGGMSTVYKVMLPEIDLVAALKCFDPSPALVKKMGRDELRRRFVAEAGVADHIRHPNVLDVWRLEETDGRLFYLMPWYCRDIGTLIGETYWADAPTRMLRPERAARYFFGILEGLSRLHEAGIVHRDLKPANIMLTDEDTVIIADFGLSRARGETLAAGAGDLFFGTKYYAAPEQIRDPDAADKRADLFSAGVILYRMLTGRLPETPPRRPGEVNADLEDLWDDMIMTAIAPDPEQRFSDAGAMAVAFENARVGFEQKKKKVCSLGKGSLRGGTDNNADAANPTAGNQKNPRAEATTIAGSRAKTVFGLDDLWQPLFYSASSFISGTESGIVMDPASGRIWQQSGTPYPLTWARAHVYVEQLNKQRFGGIDTWGLPTVDELLTLLSAPSPGADFCQNPVFDTRQKWIWTADRRSPKAAWYVNVETGFVGSCDLTCYFYARLRVVRNPFTAPQAVAMASPAPHFMRIQS